MEFFATAAKGTEPALRDELRELRFRGVRCDRGGVHFAGEWDEGWRACLHSRVALRVLTPLLRFESASKDALYQGIKSINWSPYLTPRHTLAVTASCRSSVLTHTNFTAQKVKDAIVDQQRDKYGVRPDVDRRDPDVHIFLHLVKNQATVYLDLAGESLHRRGYRKQTHEAPLKETLAAAMVRFSRWDREVPFCDPMCGSGTIAIEAAMLGLGLAPGLLRDHFGFERWPLFDASARRRMNELRGQARDQRSREPFEVIASDIDEKAIAVAKINAKAAGVVIQFSRRSIMDLKPLDPPGVIVINPPYGKRLDADKKFFGEMGKMFRSLHRHRICVLSGKREMQRAIPLKPESFQILYNGDIECRLVIYEVR
jgi:23S rRNA G2445 N2-methylase RlmL